MKRREGVATTQDSEPWVWFSGLGRRLSWLLPFYLTTNADKTARMSSHSASEPDGSMAISESRFR